MNAQKKISLSSIRTMILCAYPLSIDEYGHCYYDGDGDGVNKSPDEAYVWYRVAQCAGNSNVDSLVNYLSSKLMKRKRDKLSSRARHIYERALQTQPSQQERYFV